jgi:chromosome segregation ATPase
MNRASVNSQLKEVDKVERRMKCQNEEFEGALKQHEADKLALAKYMKEVEGKNEKLEAEKAALEKRVEEAEAQAENYKLAFEEFKEERESLLKYWKQDQAKLAKLVGPNYDEIEINDVRLMDLNTVESMANSQAAKALDDVERGAPGLSPFQKRMQERTRSLQSSLANETSVVYRMNPDGTLRPPSPEKVAEAPATADPDKAQCYWSPLDQCFHPLSEAEKGAAAGVGATLSKAVLQQESEEVRQLQRRVAELEFSATSAGLTEDEVDSMRRKLQECSLRMEEAERKSKESDRRQKQLEAELVVSKSGGAAGGADAGQVATLRSQVQKLESELTQEKEDKYRIAEQAATEKEMFIGIATGLENEVKETKQAMEQVLEEYPHLKTLVNQALPQKDPALA